MSRTLRGTRYLRPENQALADFITNSLFTLDYYETCRWYTMVVPALEYADEALLGCNDRYFLMTGLLGREDMLHPWLFDRCREVEHDPDGYVDLWARYHAKSSIITTAGTIQDIVCDPELTTAIFSVVKGIAQEFLAQIKNEFETNDHLKDVYSDVLYQNPRTKGPDGRPAKWSLARGITVKRKGRPKEATIEAHGLIDGQPTGRHFGKHVYDDVVTQDYISDDQIKKTTLRFEMADNLGTRHGVRKQIVGTRYHFADTYGVIMERGSAKARIYPATENGKLEGKPVLLSQEQWDKIKRDQRSIVSAQMLLDPLAGGEATFQSIWLTTYDVYPDVMNVYIMVDPSKGASQRSDRSAIIVLGIDQGGNKYLIDGVCHRMKLTERWEWIKSLKRRWEHHPGVEMVKVGYEQYGMLNDLEVINDMMERERNWFEIHELNTPSKGLHAKSDRIERLEPDVREGRFLLPICVYNPNFGATVHAEDKYDADGNPVARKGKIAELGSTAMWLVWTQAHQDRADAQNLKTGFHVGQIVYRPMKMTARQNEIVNRSLGRETRVVKAIKRRDENGDVYDLTRLFINELVLHPFAPHDDAIDAGSRIYDMDPQFPVAYEAASTLPVALDQDEAPDEGEVVHEGRI
jgi:hypothetical protein